MECRRNSRGNGKQHGNDQCGCGQLQCVGIARQDQMRNRIIQSHGAAQIAVYCSVPIADVLPAKRNIQPISMTESSNILGASAFSQHLLNRIARHNVDQKKDQRYHQPHNRDGVHEAHEQRPQCPHQEAFSCSSAAGFTFSTITLLMRFPLISATVSLRPSNSTVSPPFGILPNRVSRNPANVSTPPSRGRCQFICVSRSRRFTLPSRTTPPLAEVSVVFAATSNSSSTSPTSCSMASSTVTTPTVVPNSSTTMARWRRRCWNSCSRSRTGLVSGTTRTSRITCRSRSSVKGASANRVRAEARKCMRREISLE